MKNKSKQIKINQTNQTNQANQTNQILSSYSSLTHPNPLKFPFIVSSSYILKNVGNRGLPVSLFISWYL